MATAMHHLQISDEAPDPAAVETVCSEDEGNEEEWVFTPSGGLISVDQHRRSLNLPIINRLRRRHRHVVHDVINVSAAVPIKEPAAKMAPPRFPPWTIQDKIVLFIFAASIGVGGLVFLATPIFLFQRFSVLTDTVVTPRRHLADRGAESSGVAVLHHLVDRPADYLAALWLLIAVPVGLCFFCWTCKERSYQKLTRVSP